MHHSSEEEVEHTAALYSAVVLVELAEPQERQLAEQEPLESVLELTMDP